MSKKHQKELFQSHLSDLRRIAPGVREIFVCPICFELFPSESVEGEVLDVGHVWPKYFRTRSDQAKHQQVLLCKRCNSNAGKAGDAIMQEDVQMNEAKKTGKLGLRKLRLTTSSGRREALDLEAFVQETGKKSMRLGFPKYRKQSQKRYFEEQMKKFYQYASESGCNVLVYPPRGGPDKPFGDPANAPLVQAGFLTSAYLLAFYEYGYRYILGTFLDPVRNYIKGSWNRVVDSRLNFEESKDICVWRCSEPTHFCDDPQIGFVIPANEETPFHQEVRFLNYHIRLPVPSGIERRNLLLQLFGTDELPLKDGQLFSSYIFVSGLDHPILMKLQGL
jgi:hypothetical protein